MAGLLEQLDGALSDLFQGWNVYSTVLLVGILGFAGWVVASNADADTHPLLLARQAQASYVRQPGESAIFRSPETPHGYPLRTGLAVKPPGAPMYSAGKDGDLRDIWRRVTGEIPLEKKASSSGTATIKTVFGKEDLSEHHIPGVTKEIAIVGKHLQDHNAKRVAIYLPNSLEFLAVLFAGAFYGFTPILIPYNQPHATLVELLQATRADALIAQAGSVPLAEVTRGVPALRQIMWIVEKTSRHMDWSEVPEGIGGKVDVSVWHELVQDSKNTETTLPTNAAKAPGVVFLWQEAVGKPAEIVEFSQQNIASAVGSLITSLPTVHRLSASDTFLPADVLTNSYCLCLTLAALFSHSTVVLNSVAGPGVDLTLATRSLSPTVVVVSAETALSLHANTAATATTGPKQLAHYLESQSLAAGRLPTPSFLSTALPAAKAPIGTHPGKLRILFTSERAGLNTPPLTPHDLSDLRIFTGARIAYALTASRVAGAIAQTNIFDYRINAGSAGSSKSKHSHFGVPLSSVEVKVRDTATLKTSEDKAVGELVVAGPAVQGGEVRVGVNAVFGEDHTLAYA